MTGLYSITNRIMGAPNIALLGEDTVFTWFQTLGLTKNTAVICTGLLFAAVVIFVAVSLLPHRDWTSSASNGRQSRDE